MIQIGSNSSTLRDALTIHFKEHIVSKDDFYLTVDLPAEALPHALSAMLLERLLPKMLLNAIAESDANTPEEQEYLSDAVSSELLQNGSVENFRNTLAEGIRNLLKEGNVINVEGLLYFRLRKDLTDFYLSITDHIRKSRNHYEKNRLLQKLRDYIRDRSPQTDFLRVSGKASDYQIFDANGKTIRCVFSEEYTPEEHLLNSLLYLSPAILDLSALNHPELRKVLEDIFSERLL